MSDNPTCAALDEWAQMMTQNRADKYAAPENDFGRAWRIVRGAIYKSCFLDRAINCGEKPSKTPCPVHAGKWNGIHHGWPGRKWSDGTPAEESPMLRAWFDAGCRCFMHKCGCTTGWQPDEHCGCGVKP